MSQASNYLETALLDHVLRNTAYASPGTVYVGLFKETVDTATTNANLEAGTLTDEITTGGYARTLVSFSAASSGTISNDNVVTFPAATGSYDGTVTALAVMDASTGGNPIAYGNLTVAKLVTTGDTFQIAATNLNITLS